MLSDGARPHEPPAVVELDEVDSTNLEALRRAAAGERGPVWIAANRQSAGRGRLGRAWQSPAGNFAATLLLAPGCPAARLHQLSLVAGIAAHCAVARLVEGVADIDALRLKWPNDLLFQGAKLGGILVESSTTGTDMVAAIGIGINVAAAPRLQDRATTCLGSLGQAAVGRQHSTRQVLAAVAAEVGLWLDLWDTGQGFATIRAAWLARAGPIGALITVNTGAETIAGAFAGIDETGALLVSSVPAKPGEFRRFTFGDVSLLPPPQDQG